MFASIKLSNILKIIIAFLLFLNLIFMVGSNASATQIFWGYSKYDNSTVLKIARDAEARKDWTEAYVYYTVYLDRAPEAAVKDKKFWFDLNDRWEHVKSNSQSEQSFASDIRELIKQGVLKRDVLVQSGVRGEFSNPPSPLPGMLNPAPDEILIFVDSEFRGEWMALPVGNFVNASEMEMPDNSISSVMVGSAVRTYLCTDPGLNGTCGMFDSHVPFHHPNLANNNTGDNSISSIRVEWETNKCAPGPNEVTLFMHFDYKYPCQTLSIGDYPYPEHFNLPNDGVSSIQIGSNVQATLCRDINFGGACETFTSNDPNLSDNSIGNDQLSSIRIAAR